MYVTVQNKNQIAIHDDRAGNVLSYNYIPEEIVSVYPQGDDQIVVQTKKSMIILRRAGRTTPTFTVYQRRPLR